MRTPARILYAQPGTKADDVRHIIRVDRGAEQYNAVQPWRDLGATKTGWSFDDDVVELALAEPALDLIEKDLRPGVFALALLYQDASKVIHGRSWERVHLDGPYYDLMVPHARNRGEGSLLPLRFHIHTDTRRF